MSKVIPNIYAIDVERVKQALQGDALVEQAIHTLIQQKHSQLIEQGLSTARPYILLGEQSVGDYQVTIYGTSDNQHPHSWTNLFPQPVQGLFVQYLNLAAFFSIGERCYAISSGMGHSLFEQYIDLNFPLDAARRIMNPRLNSTIERGVSGTLYARQQQFRSSQLIVPSQNLGIVWQAIKGDVTDEIKVSRAFIDIFEPDSSKIGIEAGSSLKIRRSIEVGNFPKLLNWLDVILQEPLTTQQKEAFRFLESLEEVSPRKNKEFIEDIKLSLAENLREKLRDGHSVDFDFSHRFFTSYQSAREYYINDHRDDYSWQKPPSADEVFQELSDLDLLVLDDATSLLQSLEKIQFTAENENNLESTHANILNHLHGEVQYGTTHFFLIDGKFYRAQSVFLESVKQDFAGLLASSHFNNDTSLRLNDFSSNTQSEGDYNESYIGKDDWLVSDRVFMDNVELSDLIHWDNDMVYIIHNKLGFGVTVRDVCSQLLLSMQIMDRAIDAVDTETIGTYYDRMKTRYYQNRAMPITRDHFITKLLQTDKSKIVYVLGYAQPNPVPTNTKSSIAMFESIRLCRTDSHAFDFLLKVVHIQR